MKRKEDEDFGDFSGQGKSCWCDGMRGRPNERRDKVFFNSFFWFLFLDLIDEYDEGFNEDEEKI